MSVRYKVHALLAQWVRRYATALNAWAHMMTFWFFDRFGVDPQTVLATPSLFPLVASGLPAFYRALLRAWTALHGSLSQAGLIVGSAGTALLRADSLTCKSCYQLLLSLNPAQPHCVIKFRSNYCYLDWDSTWKTLFFMPLDRKPIDRLVSFGLSVPSDCLCGHCDYTLEHLFFHCPLAQSGLDWIESLLFLSSPLAPAIAVRHVLFGLGVPCVFCYLLSLLKFFVWSQRNDCRFRSKPPSAVGLIASIKGRLSFYSPLLFKRFPSRRRRLFSNCNGEPMAVSVRSLVTLFISVFLSVVRVCLPRSPLYCGLLGSVFLFIYLFLLVCVCVFFPLFAPPRSPSLAVLRFSWALSWLFLSVRVSLLAAPVGRLCWLHYGSFS